MTTIPNHLPKERRAVSAAAVIGGALRGLGAHHRRIVPTFLAVLLGVAFTAGTLILTDTLGTAFGAMHTDNHAGIDIAVRRPASFGTGPDAQRNRVEATLADDVATIAGVVAAAGRTSGWAQLTGPDGELLGDVSSGVDPVGENWIDDPRLNPWTLAEGAPPLGANEVVVDRQAADDLGVRIGDTLDVLALGGAHEMTITGIGSAPSLRCSTTRPPRSCWANLDATTASSSESPTALLPRRSPSGSSGASTAPARSRSSPVPNSPRRLTLRTCRTGGSSTRS
jgi:hypothetical protein